MDLPRTPSFRLDGRAALVTGGSRGIGLAIAAALSAAGAEVTVASRTAGDLDLAVEAIRAAGGQARAMIVDVTDQAAVTGAIAPAGPFDILVNSAGIARPALFLDMTEDDFDAVMGANVRSLYFVSQAVARGLVAAGRPGSIIHVSSQMGHVGGAMRTVYCASKFAVEGLTRAMAIELAPHGIRVNSLCPTFIETELTRRALSDPGFRDFVLAKIKLGRLGTIEDMMGPAVFLASDASALMTGSSVMVDGGWTAE